MGCLHERELACEVVMVCACARSRKPTSARLKGKTMTKREKGSRMPQDSKNMQSNMSCRKEGVKSNSESCGASDIEKFLDIQDCEIPYAKVEFIHPRSGKHEFVEFHADGKLEGTEWVEPEYKPASSWKFFLAGMLWSGALASLLWVIVR